MNFQSENFSPTLLNSRVAVLSAATGGIGGECARHLAWAGARGVVVNGRDEERGHRFVERLREEAPQTECLFVQGDVLDPAQASVLFERARAMFGRVDIFVHCGTPQLKPDLFMDTDPAQYQRLIDGHFTSLLHCCRQAVPLLRVQPGSAIVTIASDAGKIATPSESIIGAQKAATIMFTRTLALELGREGIRANCVTPSLVRDTLAYERTLSDGVSRSVFEKAERRAHLGLPSPADIAPLVVFLASSLSAKITGQAISVNGGISAA